MPIEGNQRPNEDENRLDSLLRQYAMAVEDEFRAARGMEVVCHVCPLGSATGERPGIQDYHRDVSQDDANVVTHYIIALKGVVWVGFFDEKSFKKTLVFLGADDFVEFGKALHAGK